MLICSYSIFLLRDHRQLMIERLSKDMRAVLVCNNFIQIFISHEKRKWQVTAQNLQCIKTFLTNRVREVAYFPQVILLWPAATAADLESFQVLESYPWKTYVFVLACPISLSFARALPKELGHWFYSQIIHLSSGMAFGNDCQMTGRG